MNPSQTPNAQRDGLYQKRGKVNRSWKKDDVQQTVKLKDKRGSLRGKKGMTSAS
jgi:hypothetical protein